MEMEANQSGPSNAAFVTVPSIIFCIISPFVVGVRFWSRMRLTVHNIGADDWTILGSMVFSVAVSILLLAGKTLSTLLGEIY
jgi:hypothetical protein